MAGMEDKEMKEKVQEIIATHEVEKVLLEPDPGRAWLYDREGNLIASNEATFSVEKDLTGRYAACMLDPDAVEGIWTCTIYDGDVVIKDDIPVQL